jgi:putative peptide zinc metalloprotease protein
VLPAIRFISFLATSPKLQKNRPRAIAVSLASITLVSLFLYTIPFPKRFLAPGIIEATSHLRVVNRSPGQVAEVLVKTGTRVEAGTPLIKMHNPELTHEKRLVLAQREEVLALLKQSVTLQGDNTRGLLEKRLTTLASKLEKISRQQQDLIVTAEQTGIWVSPNSHELSGLWLSRGADLGKIVAPEQFRFSAVVSQEEAANLFDNRVTGEIAIRLAGQSGSEVQVEQFNMIPFQQERLPSAALGWGSGGDIPVSGKDDKGLQTVEPFFQIYADLEQSNAAVLNHGHSGQIRFKLQSEPLLQQLLRKARQFLQKRYQT